MTNLNLLYKIFFASIIFFTFSCKHEEGKPETSTLKIVMLDSVNVKYDEETRLLPETIQDLCAVLISDSKDCNRTYILNPSIIRLDIDKELSLVTEIEKGGSKDIHNPKVIGRLIKNNLGEIDVPKIFTTGQKVNTNSKLLIDNFTKKKASKDSILIFSEDNSLNDYILNKKTYKVFSDVEGLRDEIKNILCVNAKTNFTLLYNPPIQNNSTEYLNSLTEIKTGKATANVEKTINSGRKTQPKLDTGDLIIVKGSEGCDICTRYYSATDNLGRVRQVTQRNSTECCPCNKTIEMRGRTYLMNCDGTPRLELVN
ncbi:hypothetical protein [Spirosoma fluminis]